MSVAAIIIRAGLASIALAGGGCANGVESDATRAPAALAARDAKTLAALEKALGEALGRARAELGPIGDGAVVTVLPPPPGSREDRSLARPVVFDLFVNGRQCFARQRGAQAGDVPLPGVACRPLAD